MGSSVEYVRKTGKFCASTKSMIFMQNQLKRHQLYSTKFTVNSLLLSVASFEQIFQETSLSQAF